MKFLNVSVAAAAVLGLAGTLTRADEPAPCSVSIGETTRIGAYRTWTNALETLILQDKGLAICQDDAILNLSDADKNGLDEGKALKLLKCKTEFKLELLFRSDNMTRNVTISKGKKILFDQDYPANPSSVGSLKILKTIPTCEQLHKLDAPTSTPAVN